MNHLFSFNFLYFSYYFTHYAHFMNRSIYLKENRKKDETSLEVHEEKEEVCSVLQQLVAVLLKWEMTVTLKKRM